MWDFLSLSLAPEVSGVLAGWPAGAGFDLKDENFGTATLLLSLPDIAEVGEVWVVEGGMGRS